MVKPEPECMPDIIEPIMPRPNECHTQQTDDTSEVAPKETHPIHIHTASDQIRSDHCILFLFLSSPSPAPSSSSRSTVSAGFSKLCTLLAMLLLLVAGAEWSSKLGRGNFDTPRDHPTLSTPSPGGGDGWGATDTVCLRGPLISYAAS